MFPKLIVLSSTNPAAGLCQDTWKSLADFDKPFLFVLGEHEESFNALAPVLHGMIPGAQNHPLITLAGAGHFLQEHVPDELVELINDFHTMPAGPIPGS